MFKKVIGILAVPATVLLVAAGPGTHAGELEVHNADILTYVCPDRYSPPPGGLKPVSLVGVRNGAFAGQVVVTAAGGLKGLKAVSGDLQGPGTIPAGMVEVCFGVPDGRPGRRGRSSFFDSLESEAPAGIKPCKGGKAVQSIWIKVRVPSEAKAGDYSGRVKLTSDAGSADVPIRLKVFNYTLPEPIKYHGHMDVVQSPESVAMAYGVKMWSKEHLTLLEKTFALLGEMGQKTLYITAIRRTHFGNEEAVVRWYRDEGGELQPDFTNAGKYLDVAVEHLGKIPGVIFYCWEPAKAEGHAGGAGEAHRITDKPVLYTLWNRKTGRTRIRTGPSWGTQESKIFWKKFTDGARSMLAERGLEESMLFGLIGDDRPTRKAMDDICNAVPKEKARWAVHSHNKCEEWQTHNIGYAIALWGIGVKVYDPEEGHGFGWKAPRWLSYYPREFTMDSPLFEHRYKLETWMGAFSLWARKKNGRNSSRPPSYACGLGRIGADFWPVLKDGRGRVSGRLPGRYPESFWGQLNLNYGIPHVLGKGKAGPLPTVRSEAFREGNQDVEVRVFVEKAVEIPRYRARVGEALAGKARAMLDDRIRLCNCYGLNIIGQKNSKFKKVPLNRRESNLALYGLAAEIGAKLGTNYIEARGPDACASPATASRKSPRSK